MKKVKKEETEEESECSESEFSDKLLNLFSI